MAMRRWLQIGLVLLIASGCAQRSDWIGGTLVTVDVTGQWVGSWSAPGSATGGAGTFDMTLRQTGPKTLGDVRLTGRNAQIWSGPIEGTISGDAFRFSRPDGRLRGEVILAGEQMSGTVTFEGATNSLRLRRRP